jgi:OPA family glycerol-3-phosphate transporter-like MFS transporter/OPA family sugar phosphate sensor protein UhpC-like MFS transporter
MSRLLAAVKTQPDVAIVLNYAPIEVDRQYRYWRVRILLTTMVGYAIYYFVRTNISAPLGSMGDELGYSREKLGTIVTIGGLMYGISKFVNGILGDHANPRYFMAFGLLGCALMNVCFGASSTFLAFGGFWLLNNFFQGMGFPPCAKSMAQWYSPGERASTFGIWHTSHMVGAGAVGALTGYLVQLLGWRWCFYIPAGIAAAGALIVFLFLRDTPGSLGLPPVEIYKGEESPRELDEEIRPEEPYREILWKYVLTSPFMWIISVANLLVYTLRYAVMTWGPMFLHQAKGFSKIQAGWLQSGSEMGGLIGALIAGYLTDRFFKGRAGRVCVLAMALLAVVVYLFRISPKNASWVSASLFIAMAFLFYVPQMLIASMAMTLGTKRASAAAVGLTGIVGYASQLITGWGIGRLVDHHGWPAAFHLMFACACATLLLMAFTWNIGAHPHSAATVEAKDVSPVS